MSGIEFSVSEYLGLFNKHCSSSSVACASARVSKVIGVLILISYILERVSATTFLFPDMCLIVLNCAMYDKCLVCLGEAESLVFVKAKVKGLWSVKMIKF